MKFFKYLLHSKLFLIGLLIRLLFMPFTAHYDLRGINFAVYQLPFNHVLNIYKVAESGPIDYLVNVNFGREYFIYPPLTYFTLGGFMWLLKPFYGPEFVHWIQGYGNDVVSVLTHPHVFRYLFLMKLPYLAFDLFAVWSLFHFAKSEKERGLMLLFWWLNPIVIFLPYLWGQFDIIPTAISVFALWVMRKRPLSGAFLLGVAAAYKNYPLMFLPLVVLAVAKNWRQGLAMFGAGILPFALTVAPFVSQSFFRSTVLLSTQSQKMLDFMWGIGGDIGVYPFVIGYSLLAFWTYYHARKSGDAIGPVVIALLLYYSVTNFHEQWFMWIMPFLVLYSVKNNFFRPLFAFLVGLFFLRLISLQGNVTTELFVWLSPAIDDLPKTRTLVGMVYDIHRIRNIVSSLYIGSTLWISSLIAKRELHL